MSDLTWRSDLSHEEWDRNLANIGGHPLQSALWGEARKEFDGLPCEYWAAFNEETPVVMARAESRKLSLIGTVAWLPRGPAVGENTSAHILGGLKHALKKNKHILYVSDHWKKVDQKNVSGSECDTCPKTIWIDLEPGKEQLWQNLDKQWRYGVGRAAREGVVVEQTTLKEEVSAFFDLCSQVSKDKGFELPASLPLMLRLLSIQYHENVDAHLFVAKVDNELAAGAFILRCGKSIHYFCGATDRKFNHERAGEAVQWAVIEWALEQGCSLYDLEGIDPVNNPGVYSFKKKMGGEEILLADKSIKGLNQKGRIISIFASYWMK